MERGGGFQQFAVQMDDVAAAGSFMQVVHVLGNDGDGVVRLQAGYEPVCQTGGGLEQLAPQAVVEVNDEFGVSHVALDAGYLFYGVFFP